MAEATAEQLAVAGAAVPGLLNFGSEPRGPRYTAFWIDATRPMHDWRERLMVAGALGADLDNLKFHDPFLVSTLGGGRYKTWWHGSLADPAKKEA